MFSTMLSIVLIFIGLFFVVRGMRSVKKLNKIRSWMEVRIEVKHSEITEDYERGKYGADTYFLPSITYTYEVGGKELESNVVFIDRKGIRSEMRVEAEALMRKILGARKGYYNPQIPSESVLVRDISSQRISHHKAVIVSGAILIFLGVFFVVASM